MYIFFKLILLFKTIDAFGIPAYWKRVASDTELLMFQLLMEDRQTSLLTSSVGINACVLFVNIGVAARPDSGARLTGELRGNMLIRW